MLPEPTGRPTVRRTLTLLLAATLVAAYAAISARGAVTPVVRTASKTGHPTHPVWYHDDVAVRIGSRLVLPWNRTGGPGPAPTWNLRGEPRLAAATTVSPP